MKPRRKIKIEWSSDFAYAIGLLATDGNLSSDGRHFDLTSKDAQLIKIFKKCLNIKNKIGPKNNGYKAKKYFHIQFGDVNFYRFLLNIGLMPKKSKIISELKIPDNYFFDFLRGHFDGDGTFYSYWDPRWKSSFMFYAVFISASRKHLDWLREALYKFLKVKGHVSRTSRRDIYYLKYAKKESQKILGKMYYNQAVTCLKRKRLKIEKTLSIIGKKL